MNEKTMDKINKAYENLIEARDIYLKAADLLEKTKVEFDQQVSAAISDGTLTGGIEIIKLKAITMFESHYRMVQSCENATRDARKWLDHCAYEVERQRVLLRCEELIYAVKNEDRNQ